MREGSGYEDGYRHPQAEDGTGTSLWKGWRSSIGFWTAMWTEWAVEGHLEEQKGSLERKQRLVPALRARLG